MRGKKAAQAANRRAGQAAESVAELREKLNAERAEWKRERAELLNDVQRLSGKNQSDIDAAAAEEIRAAKDRAREDLATLQAKHGQRASKALEVLGKMHENLPMKTFLAVSEALGVNYAEAVPNWHNDPSASRNSRRHATNKQLNKALSLVQDMEKAGRPRSIKPGAWD